MPRLPSKEWHLGETDPSLDIDYLCPGAAVTKHHRLGGLHNRNLSSPSSGGWPSEIDGSAWLVPSERSFLASSASGHCQLSLALFGEIYTS